MRKKRTDKKLILITGICVLLIGLFVLLNTYAFWRISGEQTGSNYVIGKCLNIELEELENSETGDPIGGFLMDNAWPMTDEEGQATSGYTFKLENTCSDPVDYQLVLESLKVKNEETEDPDDYYPEEKYFANNRIKVQFDNGTIKTYDSYGNVDNDTGADYKDEIRETKHVLYGTIPGKTDDPNNTSNIVTHNIKMWISEKATTADIEKVFRSKVKVFAGQQMLEPSFAVTDESCFTFDSETGTITDFDADSCESRNLVIPESINNVTVQKIAFSQPTTDIAWDYVDLTHATGLKEIGNRTFYNYVGKDYELIIPDSVETIGMISFNSFNGKNLVLGANVSTINSQAFYNYEGVGKELVIPGNDTTINLMAFNSYHGPKLVLNEGIKTITGSFGSYVGENEDLIIPDSVTSMLAFGSFNGKQIKFGPNLTALLFQFHDYVGDGYDITIPGSISSVHSSLFESYIGRNAQLTIEEGVSVINSSSFRSYIGKDFELPSTITKISSWAFRDFTGTITFNKTRAEYAQVTKSSDWVNESATIMCKENNAVVPCE